jgi:hypothetical protein
VHSCIADVISRCTVGTICDDVAIVNLMEKLAGMVVFEPVKAVMWLHVVSLELSN